MVPAMSLWLPIFLSVIVVFVASSIIHMVLRYHRSDYRRLPSEDAVMEALRAFKIPPGDYMMPCADSPSQMNDEAFIEKQKRGPVAIVTVMESGSLSMGASLAQWFVYSVVVGLFVAYITGRALLPGVEYRVVFQLASSIAFVGYSLALWPISIWYKRAWSTTAKSTFDGLIYGLLTGGVFGWLWPT